MRSRPYPTVRVTSGDGTLAVTAASRDSMVTRAALRPPEVALAWCMLAVGSLMHLTWIHGMGFGNSVSTLIAATLAVPGLFAAVEEGIIAAAGGRRRLTRTLRIDTTGVVDDPAHRDIVALADSRGRIRRYADGPAGAQIGSDTLAAVDAAIWEALGFVERSDSLHDALACTDGSGSNSEKLRSRLTVELRRNAGQLEQYVTAVGELADAAAETDAEFRHLAVLGIDAPEPDSGLTASLDAAIIRLRAAAEAARDVRSIDEHVEAAAVAELAAAATS